LESNCPAMEEADESIHVDSYGVPHKRLGRVALPTFFQSNNVVNLPTNLQRLGKDDVVISTPVGIWQDMQFMEMLVGCCEHQLPAGTSVPAEASHRNFKTRLIEQIAEPIQPGQQQVHLSVAPPWLLPKAWWGQESCGKIVVLTSDPRYLLLQQPDVWGILHQCCHPRTNVCHSLTCDVKVASAVEGPIFIENYLRSSAKLCGDELEKLAHWAMKEAENPDTVKLFFIEDFITDPETTIATLFRFLGQKPSDVEQKVAQAISVQRDRGTLSKMDRLSSTEPLYSAIRQFEEFLADLPTVVQDLWNEKLSFFPILPQPRLSYLKKSLEEHSVVSAPRWFLSHMTGICKPCSYAPRGLCHMGDSCNFCHDPGHALPRHRPSQKQRHRKKRQMKGIRVRTPSPEGLSN